MVLLPSKRRRVGGLDLVRRRRALAVDLGAQRRGVALRHQARDRRLDEIRIAEQVRAVGVGVAHGLDHEMRRLRIVGLEPEALQHVEHLEQHHAAGGRRRHRHDAQAAIAAAQHRALDRLVVLQVVAGHQPAGLAHRGGNLVGDRPFVERARALLGNRFQRVGEIGLHQQRAARDQRAVGLEEQLRGRRPARHPRDRRAAGVLELVADLVAVARQIDRRRDQLRQLEFAGAVFLQRQRQPGDGARHADGEALLARLRRIGLALGVEEGLARGRGRRGLAVVDGDVLRLPRLARWITMKPPPPMLPARG